MHSKELTLRAFLTIRGVHFHCRDLVFPHHENEVAQSLAACDCCGGSADGVKSGHAGEDQQLGGSDRHEQPEPAQAPAQLARFWVHNGFVNVESEKMSKSLGNFFTIRDVLTDVHPLALRWMLLGTHYRAPLNFTSSALDQVGFL